MQLRLRQRRCSARHQTVRRTYPSSGNACIAGVAGSDAGSSLAAASCDRKDWSLSRSAICCGYSVRQFESLQTDSGRPHTCRSSSRTSCSSLNVAATPGGSEAISAAVLFPGPLTTCDSSLECECSAAARTLAWSSIDPFGAEPYDASLLGARAGRGHGQAEPSRTSIDEHSRRSSSRLTVMSASRRATCAGSKGV